MSTKVAIIGECMLELRQGDANPSPQARRLDMGFGGDTLNTAIYMARAGVAVSYVTGLGDDSLSDWLITEWQAEGVDCSLVERLPDSVPGMYMINVAEDGERSFLYWRAGSPASRLFDDPSNVARLAEHLAEFDYIYLSGISLAILPESSCTRLLNLLSEYRAQGGRIAFDGNYRPKLWNSVERAQSTYTRMAAITDIALPTFDDEVLLHGYDSPQELVHTLKSAGVAEGVVKLGGEGCLLFSESGIEVVATSYVKPVDTTAAGDSFNAGYLSARLTGATPVQACKAGHQLAGKVIQNLGAIIPRD